MLLCVDDPNSEVALRRLDNL